MKIMLKLLNKSNKLRVSKKVILNKYKQKENQPKTKIKVANIKVLKLKMMKSPSKT